MRNYELLDATLDHIKAYPEEWNQELFVNPCGTRFCFAGTAVRIAHPRWYFEIDARGKTTGQVLNAQRDVVGRVSDVAQIDLGLHDDEDQEDLFFNMTTSPATLGKIIARWKREEGFRG